MLSLEPISKVRCRRLWDLFAEALKEKGVTRKDVADACGVSLYGVDRGRVPRDWAAVRKVGKFLGVNLRELYLRWWLARRLKAARKVKVPSKAEPVSEKEWRGLVEKARELYRSGTGVREIMKRAKQEGWLGRLRVALSDAERDAYRVTLAVFGVRKVDELRCPVCGFVPKLGTLYNYYLRQRRLGDRPWEEWKCRQCKGLKKPITKFELWLRTILPKRKPLKALCRWLRKELGVEARYSGPSAIIVKGKQINIRWPDLDSGGDSVEWKDVFDPKFWGIDESCKVPRVIERLLDQAKEKGLI